MNYDNSMRLYVKRSRIDIEDFTKHPTINCILSTKKSLGRKLNRNVRISFCQMCFEKQLLWNVSQNSNANIRYGVLLVKL